MRIRRASEVSALTWRFKAQRVSVHGEGPDARFLAVHTRKVESDAVDTVWTAGAASRIRDAAPHKNPTDGPSAHVETLVLPERLGELGVVRSGIAAGGDALHGRDIVART